MPALHIDAASLCFLCGGMIINMIMSVGAVNEVFDFMCRLATVQSVLTMLTCEFIVCQSLLIISEQIY